MKVMKRFILGVSISLVLFGCGKESGDINKETKPKIQTEAGSYTIDINSYSALAGDADYVIIGEVIEELGIDYKWPVILENEDGSEREETIPFTNYSVKVIENLKGELTQEKLINITKRGGISKDGKYCILAENDILPSKDNTYIFYIYAQDDGSNLSSGPNSTIPIDSNNNSEFSTRTILDDAEINILEEVREGVENQIVTEREKSVSNDDVSVHK